MKSVLFFPKFYFILFSKFSFLLFNFFWIPFLFFFILFIIKKHVELIEILKLGYNIKQQFIKSLTKIKFLRPYEMLYFFSNSVLFFTKFCFPFILMVSLNINNQKHL